MLKLLYTVFDGLVLEVRDDPYTCPESGEQKFGSALHLQVYKDHDELLYAFSPQLDDVIKQIAVQHLLLQAQGIDALSVEVDPYPLRSMVLLGAEVVDACLS